MTSNLTREEALELLKQYNQEPFHIQHGLTVEKTMRWFANELGYGDEADYWSITGLLHDIDLNNIQKNIAGKRRSCCKRQAWARI